jgi:hypothetical protein
MTMTDYELAALVILFLIINAGAALGWGFARWLIRYWSG